MQWNRASAGGIRPIAAFAMLDVELIIIEPEPYRHRFPRQVRVDLISHASNADLGISRHLVGFRFARKGAKTLPTAHLAQPLGRQMLHPIFHAGMRLRAVRTVVIAQEVVEEPGIRLGFGLRDMEVIQGLMSLFDGAKGPLHFAFGTGRGAAAVVATGRCVWTAIPR